MPQTIDDPDDDGSKNMVSNLPLLFADGYPTSLDKITEPQLEKFIPFMVQCSLGYIHIHSIAEFNKPVWWPSDVEFMKPFRKPKPFTGNWLQKMRELVVVCYSFHRSVYLLRYCTDLASFQPTALRFINNYNSTTSLYERSTNKLLVTFRNENMLYDQELNSRKCLLPKQSSSQTCLDAQEEMVISAGFDIYLCDNCDAELYSYGALVEHEKVCHNEQDNAEDGESSDDDDVIFCGEIFEEQLPLDSEARKQAEQQKMISFLSQNFMLRCTIPADPSSSGALASVSKSSIHNTELDGSTTDSGPAGKYRRLPRRTRQIVTLAKSTQIPLSSPLGQFMVRSTKTIFTPEYLFERLDRMERFCVAPSLPFGVRHLLRQGGVNGGTSEVMSAQDRRLPKWLLGKTKSGGSGGSMVTFKRPADDTFATSNRQYKFPRRQFSTRQRMENFLFYNKLLLQRCQPLTIQLKRLTPAEVHDLSLLPGIERQQREAEQAAMYERQRRKELVENAMIIDSIDLCSSDEDPEEEAMEIDLNYEERLESNTEYKTVLGDTDGIETIVLEMDDADSTSSSDTAARASQFYATIPPQTKTSSIGVHSPTPLKQRRSSIIGTLLHESTFRLNQSLPAGRGSLVTPMYLYANCNQAAVSVSGEPGLANGNSRFAIKKGANLPLKENMVNGFEPIGNVNDDIVGNGQCVRDPSPVHQAAVQPCTVLLATPIANGHTLFGTIPVSYGATSSLHSRTNASVVQTLTSTTTFVNQTVHSLVSVNRASGPSAATVTGTAATNIQ